VQAQSNRSPFLLIRRTKDVAYDEISRRAQAATVKEIPGILGVTRELLQAMIEVNGIEEEDVASVIFTMTPDLNTAYPAQAAREVGWKQTALLGCQETAVPGGLERCIRILVHWNTTKRLDEILHVYMHGAEKLRPDLIYPQNKLVLNEEGRGEL
jgi:chorismate mutase